MLHKQAGEQRGQSCMIWKWSVCVYVCVFPTGRPGLFPAPFSSKQHFVIVYILKTHFSGDNMITLLSQYSAVSQMRKVTFYNLNKSLSSALKKKKQQQQQLAFNIPMMRLSIC